MTALPAIHYSRRALIRCQYIATGDIFVRVSKVKVYFGGDSAMEPMLGQAGHKHGPIDLALIGIGVYAARKLLHLVHAPPE